MKHWNIGNTTVRNPDRIKEGLRILKNFEGQSWNQEHQIEYLKELVAAGLVENTKKEPRSQGISGRKWAAVLNQLGLARAWAKSGPVTITPVGNALLDGKSLEEEIFLRQLLKYQLPSPLENGKDYIGFKISPFKATLKVLSELRDLGLEGITKEEISLYLITTVDQNYIGEAIAKIVEYRKERKKLVGRVSKNKFYVGKVKELILTLYEKELKDRHSKLKRVYDEFHRNNQFLHTTEAIILLNQMVAGGKGSKTKKAQETFNALILGLQRNIDFGDLLKILEESFIGTKGRTLQDYTDSAVRYFSKSGLLSISGEKLIIKDTEENLVEFIVGQNLTPIEDANYLDELYNPALPYLPIDSNEFLEQNLQVLYAKRNQLAIRLNEKPEDAPDLANKSLSELRKDEWKIKKELMGLREIEFSYRQAKEIDDILEYFNGIKNRTLLGGSAYLPAYLEWTIWRAFLAIDSIKNEIHSTRNFEIDEELNPIHHARGGVPDMIFEYENFTIVCEATLSTRANQWSAEGESVPRHVGEVTKKYPSKPVYGLFFAPTIDPNTAQQFYNSTFWLEKEKKFVALRIIPLTIDEFISTLREFQKETFKVDILKAFFEKLLNLKEKTQNGVEWREALARHLVVGEDSIVGEA